jgi:hypothetical protein
MTPREELACELAGGVPQPNTQSRRYKVEPYSSDHTDNIRDYMETSTAPIVVPYCVDPGTVIEHMEFSHRQLLISTCRWHGLVYRVAIDEDGHYIAGRAKREWSWTLNG